MPCPFLTLGKKRVFACIIEGVLCLDPAGEITPCSNTSEKTGIFLTVLLGWGVLPEMVLWLSLLSTAAQAISRLFCSRVVFLPKAMKNSKRQVPNS